MDNNSNTKDQRSKIKNEEASENSDNSESEINKRSNAPENSGTPADESEANPEPETTEETAPEETKEKVESENENDSSVIPSDSEESQDSESENQNESGDPSATPQDDKKKDNPNAKWYVVHTYSGHENKVAHTLKQRIESEHLENKILEVLVPMQEKIEIKSGKKVNIKEKIFPGYILVKMVLDDISWLAVRTTQGVTSFVGMGNKPTPISESEVQTIVKFTQSEAPMYKQVFSANDTIKIVDGPFADFIGKIDSVDEEKGKVRVLVSIFGRETPVELDFLQIKKI
ncbi:transcription termination/antitermination factor NusG [Candidatus Daviesbacteria bacterium]|nr:transcription termination/antitermination factor NusG [Candidatus Daviesbacteria bacterium]